MSLCVVLSCLKLISFSGVVLFLFFVVVVDDVGGCHGRVGGARTVISHLYFDCEHRTRALPLHPPFFFFVCSKHLPIKAHFVLFFSSMANWARASLSPLLPKKEAALGVVKLLTPV